MSETPEKIEAMIDIETLDTLPSSVVLSIGAQLFTQESGHEPFEPFYAVLDLQTQFRAGRTVSEGTLLWWMAQSQQARDFVFTDIMHRVSPSAALDGLNKYVERIKWIWAKSPSFDLVILESLMRDFNRKPAWHYRSAQDVRTIYDAAGMNVPPGWKPTVVGVEHHPVADCRWQIAEVREARRRIHAA